jgi:iron(III) transport system ATP-binding protein
LIDVLDVSKRFVDRRSSVRALQGVTLRVAQGSFYTLLGPSGCGKTTLLRCIAGLESPDSGEIRLNAQVVWSARVHVPPHRRGVSMVFQSYAIWPHLNVFENVAFPLTTLRPRPPRAEIARRVEEALELVGLAGLGDRASTRLSGGQQQRLALARAIVARPHVLLLDEPLSNLDAGLRAQMRTEVLSLQRRLGITALYVTHDQTEALALSDRIAVLRDGSLVQEGTPYEIYSRPRGRFVAEFVGGANILSGRWRRDAGGPVLACAVGDVRCPGEGCPEGPGTVTVRPEGIALTTERPSPRENVFAAVVLGVQFLGAHHEYRVRVGSGELRVHASAGRPLAVGEPAFVHIPPESCVALED